MSVVLSVLRWPSLAQDLAVMTVPGSPLTELSTIYTAYNITEKELQEILVIPAFQNMFKQSLDSFKTQGASAGAKYRAASLSQSLSEKLFRDAQESKMEPKDAIKLLEVLLKTAGLQDIKENLPPQVNVGVSFALPGSLKDSKLKHAFPVEVSGNVPIC